MVPLKHTANTSSNRTSSSATMKAFKVVPLVLAGLCGYLHTTINRRFNEIGDLMHGDQLKTSLIDMPHTSNSKTGRATAVAQSIDESAESSSSATIIKSRRRNLDMRLLQGPAMDTNEAEDIDLLSNTDWSPPPEDDRILVNCAEHHDELLQYTLDLLPNHRNPPSANDPEDILKPQAYAYQQFDIIVPASGQDDRLFLFAKRLGVAVSSFTTWYENERRPAIVRRLKQEDESEVKIAPMDGADNVNGNGIGDGSDSDKQNNDAEEEKQSSGSTDGDTDLGLRFRLIITRYPLDTQKTEADFEVLHKELTQLTTLPLENIEIIRVGHDALDVEEFPLKFNRAHARNVLQDNACQVEACIVTAMDVDMQILPIYFHRALKNVIPVKQSYFPIVFSEYNPNTVQMVQDFLFPKERRNNKNHMGEEDDTRMLPPFSDHRGLWRDFGYGMYALAGSDVKRFRFDESFLGWGHEDNDFYKLVKANMKVHRQREEGLLHGWHSKNCEVGKDDILVEQLVDCVNSRDIMEGDPLGLLLREPLKKVKFAEVEIPERVVMKLSPITKPPGEDDGKYITNKKVVEAQEDDENTDRGEKETAIEKKDKTDGAAAYEIPKAEDETEKAQSQPGDVEEKAENQPDPEEGEKAESQPEINSKDGDSADAEQPASNGRHVQQKPGGVGQV